MSKLKIRIWDEHNSCWATDYVQVYPNEEFLKNGFIVSHSTHTFDENNREIYEGDVVTTIYDEIGIVVFEQEFVSFRISSKGISIPLRTLRHINSEPAKIIPVYKQVIGNVYEQPELLKYGQRD